jgi:hypothetical protein
MALVVVLATVVLSLGGSPATGAKGSILKRAALGQLRASYIPVKIRRHGRVVRVKRRMPAISAGTIAAAREALGRGFAAKRFQKFVVPPDGGPEDHTLPADGGEGGNANGSGKADMGFRLGTYGCSGRTGSGSAHGKDTRANQDCTFRRQAEEDITYNPTDRENLLGGQNDSRVGFNQCGIDWSLDNGQHWGDLLPPFRQKVNNPAAEEPTASDPNRHTIVGGPGTLHTYDADSDPTVAFDAFGNSYFSCVAFDVFSNASLLWVSQSPAKAKGSFFFNLNTFDRRFVVAEDNNIAAFHDKEFITADPYKSSPNAGNVYVTWTVFRFSTNCGPQPNPGAEERYCQSPIFGSMSTDGGRHWSTPELFSGTSDTLCFFGNFFDPTANPHSCNFDQGSDPVVLPNGDLQVVFNNGNTAAGNPNGQELGVHCHPTGNSAAGTAHLNCLEPSFVGSGVIVGEPLCDFGRGPEECVPGPYIRTNDYPRITQENTQGNVLYTTWQDYRNGEYDIQLAKSTDGGLTWTQGGTVNPDRGLDHYFPATDRVPGGRQDRNGVSYYRSERVPGENTTPPGGFAPGMPGVQASDSDYVVAGGRDLDTPYDFVVVSPVFPPPDGIQAGFNGDYSGLTINKGNQAHPIWSDTRNENPFPENAVVHDEDVFTDLIGLPNGHGHASVGVIGRNR